MATFFTHSGTIWLTQLMNATLTATTYFGGWGTGGPANGADVVSKGTSAISSEQQARVAAPSSISAFNQIQWTFTMTADAARSVTNAALFHNTSGSVLIAGDFSTVPLATNDRIAFTVTLTST